MTLQPPLPILTNLYGQLQKKYSNIKSHRPHCYLQKDAGPNVTRKRQKLLHPTSLIYSLLTLTSLIQPTPPLLSKTSPIPISLPPKAFNPSDITHITKTLKKKKTPGYDLTQLKSSPTFQVKLSLSLPIYTTLFCKIPISLSCGNLQRIPSNPTNQQSINVTMYSI